MKDKAEDTRADEGVKLTQEQEGAQERSEEQNVSNVSAETAGQSVSESAEKKESVEEWKTKAAYLLAEIENMRKRFVRERSELIKMANEGLLKAILPVVDNLELAIKAAKDAEAKLAEQEKNNPVLKSLFQGVEMTLKHMEATLEQVGVKTIKALGERFDPTVHEAVGHAKVEEHEDDKVAAEVQRGFSLHERVLRPARVIVNKK